MPHEHAHSFFSTEPAAQVKVPTSGIWGPLSSPGAGCACMSLGSALGIFFYFIIILSSPTLFIDRSLRPMWRVPLLGTSLQVNIKLWLPNQYTSDSHLRSRVLRVPRIAPYPGYRIDSPNGNVVCISISPEPCSASLSFPLSYAMLLHRGSASFDSRDYAAPIINCVPSIFS